MVISKSNSSSITSLNGEEIIVVDEVDHYSEEWVPPFAFRESISLNKKQKISESYTFQEPLGEGKFGRVFRCVEKKSLLNLAAKCIKIKRDSDLKQVENEIDIMTKMRHKCIAQIYDAFYIEQKLEREVILIMEIVEGGELFDRVVDETYILTELAVAMITFQICEAIRYIHRNKFIHLDLKPENIMCVSQQSNQIKLIDFGLAQHYDGEQDLLFMAGTPEFAAPEVIKYEPLDFHSDTWSVGVITYILLSGQSPFLGANIAITYNKVEKGQWSFCEEFDDNEISADARDFISKLLILKKEDRMLPSDCLQHPWLVKGLERAHNPIVLTKNVVSGDHSIDKEKLKKYVKNIKFRRVVFGVLFINQILKMLSTMQLKKNENGIKYAKNLLNAARKSKNEGKMIEPQNDGCSSHSGPNLSTLLKIETTKLKRRDLSQSLSNKIITENDKPKLAKITESKRLKICKEEQRLDCESKSEKLIIESKAKKSIPAIAANNIVEGQKNSGSLKENKISEESLITSNSNLSIKDPLENNNNKLISDTTSVVKKNSIRVKKKNIPPIITAASLLAVTNPPAEDKQTTKIVIDDKSIRFKDSRCAIRKKSPVILKKDELTTTLVPVKLECIKSETLSNIIEPKDDKIETQVIRTTVKKSANTIKISLAEKEKISTFSGTIKKEDGSIDAIKNIDMPFPKILNPGKKGSDKLVSERVVIPNGIHNFKLKKPEASIVGNETHCPLPTNATPTEKAHRLLLNEETIPSSSLKKKPSFNETKLISSSSIKASSSLADKIAQLQSSSLSHTSNTQSNSIASELKLRMSIAKIDAIKNNNTSAKESYMAKISSVNVATSRPDDVKYCKLKEIPKLDSIAPQSFLNCCSSTDPTLKASSSLGDDSKHKDKKNDVQIIQLSPLSAIKEISTKELESTGILKKKEINLKKKTTSVTNLHLSEKAGKQLENATITIIEKSSLSVGKKEDVGQQPQMGETCLLKKIGANCAKVTKDDTSTVIQPLKKKIIKVKKSESVKLNKIETNLISLTPVTKPKNIPLISLQTNRPDTSNLTKDISANSSPRIDEEPFSFELLKKRLESRLSNRRSKSPNSLFGDTSDSVRSLPSDIDALNACRGLSKVDLCNVKNIKNKWLSIEKASYQSNS
uniref:Protein kinase domain-containing protein n=1 Tax=Rhabditophanes sp. KR3021 TaxID=114890 RepID=A0AC35U583_9BILA